MTKSGSTRSSDPTHHQDSLHSVHFTRARPESLSHLVSVVACAQVEEQEVLQGASRSDWRQGQGRLAS